MVFNLDKIIASFVNIRTNEQTYLESYIEDIINSVDRDPLAVSEQNVLFAKTSELGNYFYVIALIIGSFKIKTNKAAKLSIKGHNFNLVLNSDTNEFESDHSNVSNRYITRIDFKIEEEDVSKFDQTIIKFLSLSTKKQQIVFNTI